MICIDMAQGKGVMIEMGGRGLKPEHTMHCLQTAERLNSKLLRMVIDDQDFEPDLPAIISNYQGSFCLS